MDARARSEWNDGPMHVRLLYATADYEGTCRFWAEAMALPVERSWDEPDNRGTMFVAGVDARVEVLAESASRPAIPPSGVGIGLEVADAAGTHDRVIAMGVPVSTRLWNTPWGHLAFDVVDPNGLVITCFQVL